MSNFKYEVEKLNKAVNELRGQLFESEAENQKLKLELECVLELLKKAWSGDRIASMHITNILNNAEINSLKQIGISESVVSQEPSLDKHQRENLLRNRNEYLNTEFMKTVTTMSHFPVSHNSSKTMSRPSSSVLRRPMSTGGRPGARPLGAARRAQSAFGGDRGGNGNPGERLQMLQGYPARPNSLVNPPVRRFNYIAANERLELFGLKPVSQGIRYDDPNRYNKDGLYHQRSSELKITGKPGSLSTVPFVYSQGLQPNASPRVHASQIIAARRQGRPSPSVTPSRRPPSGILAVQDRPLKNEVTYYEAANQMKGRPQSGRPKMSMSMDSESDVAVRPKSSMSRGIRFADGVDIMHGDDDDAASGSRSLTPKEERKKRATVAIQRRIGISDNAIVVPR